ncbi:MAG: pyruvate kinase, partial [Kangiellaceae bacterium]
MLRRTKIVTTLGPSTNNAEALEKLFKAGANVVRMNFSHGSAQDHIERAKLVRSVAEKLGLNIAILGDLQGPKIRIARFKDSKIELQPGATFLLDADLEVNDGDQTKVGIDYKELPRDCDIGDILLLDDGRLELEVTKIIDNVIETKVII